MEIEIKHRFEGNVLFSLECGSLRIALEAACKEGADLRDADLAGADLTGAYLRGADLAGAYLTGAYLRGADLRGADLRGAYLTGAYLRGAYLRGADLAGAYLTGAYLRGADLRGADLTGADLTGADLTGAVGLKDAFGVGSEALKKATPEESIANLDKVREIVLDNEKRLKMSVWHDEPGWKERSCAEEAVCGTSHCLAGWLQVCATDPAIRRMDSHLAGIVSAPVAAKMFFRDAPEVLTWLTDRKYAEEAKDYA